MPLSVQRSVVESFSFRGKDITTMHVPDLRKCPVGIDVSRAIGYADDNNGRRGIDMAKHFGLKIEHCLPASKEQDALGQIMQAFKGVDLYFPKYKLAIECDEFDHRDRNIG